MGTMSPYRGAPMDLDAFFSSFASPSPDIVEQLLASTAPQPTPTPPPPTSRVPPLKRGRAPMPTPTPPPTSMRTPAPPQIPPGRSWTVPAGPPERTFNLASVLPEAENPAPEDVRSRLGFSWGKGANVDPATGRPRRSGTFNLPGSFTYGSRTGGASRSSEAGGGYIMSDNAESRGRKVEETVRELTGQRAIERLQTGTGPAPATAGEQLQDQRGAARDAELQADLEQELALLDRRFAAGEITREDREAAAAAMQREFHMRRGTDPRYFDMR